MELGIIKNMYFKTFSIIQSQHLLERCISGVIPLLQMGKSFPSSCQPVIGRAKNKVLVSCSLHVPHEMPQPAIKEIGLVTALRGCLDSLLIELICFFCNKAVLNFTKRSAPTFLCKRTLENKHAINKLRFRIIYTEDMHSVRLTHRL